MQYIKPAWTEGMRITPEHFQQQDGYFQELIIKHFNYLEPNQWGLSSCEFDNDLLSVGDINLLSASGIFPDGTVFDYHANADDKLSLSKEQLKDASTVYLGLMHVKKHQLKQKQVQDINDPHKQPSKIIGLSLALKLLTDHDELEEYTTIPVVKLSNSAIIENDFISPSIDVKNSHWLSNKLIYIIKMLKKKHNIIRYSIFEPLQSQSLSSKNDLWLLSIISRHICQLEILQSKQILHPEKLYDILYQMLAELSVAYEKDEKLIEVVSYQHENSFSCFDQLINKILSFLQTQAHHQAIEVLLQQDQYGIWKGNFDTTKIANDATIILSLYHENAFSLSHITQENDIKICNSENIERYIKLQLPGLPAIIQNTVPPQIPYHANTNYYMLDTQHSLWQDIISNEEISIMLNNEAKDGLLKLWIVPNK